MAGVLLSAISTFCFSAHFITPFTWMLLSTTGLYLAYLPFNCVYFERMLATYKINGNIGFVMYIADAFGYLGSVSVMIFKEFVAAKVSWLDFFISSGYIISGAGSLLIAGSMVYFHAKHRHWETQKPVGASSPQII